VLSETDFAFDGLQLGTLSFGDGMAQGRNFPAWLCPQM
jgi:hypothetical protein